MALYPAPLTKPGSALKAINAIETMNPLGDMNATETISHLESIKALMTINALNTTKPLKTMNAHVEHTTKLLKALDTTDVHDELKKKRPLSAPKLRKTLNVLKTLQPHNAPKSTDAHDELRKKMPLNNTSRPLIKLSNSLKVRLSYQPLPPPSPFLEHGRWLTHTHRIRRRHHHRTIH
jgi:hypothetical protein